MASKILSGARIQVAVGGSTIGWLENCSWQVSLDTQDAYVLGRTGPAEIDYVAIEPISGQIGGWHVLNHGVYAELGLPLLQNLLTADYTQLTLFDRVSNTRVGAITSVRLLGFSGGASARQLMQQSVPFKGILLKTESGSNSESGTAIDLP